MDLIERILFKKISASGLAVFRIAYHLVFLFEVVGIFNYRQLYFDELPYLRPYLPDTSPILILWMLVIFSIIVGYRTRVFSIVNYVFTLVFISSAVSFEYHMFYVYTGMNFLLMFLPSHASFSVDYLLKKIRLAKQGIIYKTPKIAKINYLIPVFIGLGLVYFDSVIFYKVKSDVWMRGLGLWLPSSLPQVTKTDFQWFLNQEKLVKFLSYVTLVFEFIFVFVFWNKKFRIPLFFVGLGLHIGICIEYPIPYFGLGCLSIYLLMIPVSFWEELGNRLEKLFIRNENQKVKGFFEAQFRIVELKKNKEEGSFVNFSSKSIKIRNFFFIALVIISVLAQRQVHYSFFDSNNSTYIVNKFLIKYFGITKHPVFMDNHFKGYEHIYTLKYKDAFLPLLDEKGMPSEYISGGTWVNWTWRVNGPYVNETNYSFRNGLVKYSSFWIHKNGLNNSKNIEFEIVRKKIRAPFKWESDLLKKNIDSPWEKAGNLVWSGGRANFSWNITNNK